MAQASILTGLEPTSRRAMARTRMITTLIGQSAAQPASGPATLPTPEGPASIAGCAGRG